MRPLASPKTCSAQLGVASELQSPFPAFPCFPFQTSKLSAQSTQNTSSHTQCGHKPYLSFLAEFACVFESTQGSSSHSLSPLGYPALRARSQFSLVSLYEVGMNEVLVAI